MEKARGLGIPTSEITMKRAQGEVDRIGQEKTFIAELLKVCHPRKKNRKIIGEGEGGEFKLKVKK